jgi:hypothetical protein
MYWNFWVPLLGILQIALLASVAVAFVRLKNTGQGFVRRTTMRVAPVRRFLQTGKQATLPQVRPLVRIAQLIRAIGVRLSIARSLARTR